MSIDIYSDYKIKVAIRYNYVNQEDSEPNDYVFSNDIDYTEEIVNGAVLMKIISDWLSNEDINDVSIRNNTLIIKNFDPQSGECSDIELKFKRVKGKDN